MKYPIRQFFRFRSEDEEPRIVKDKKNRMVLVHHRAWKEIVNTKTKRSTGISIIRGTLLRYLTQSLKQINDENMKKNILWEEMFWLNQYWGQQIPKSDLSLKYWQRLFVAKSIDVRRDFYE